MRTPSLNTAESEDHPFLKDEKNQKSPPLYSFDESKILLDPFSELGLFLTQKILQSVSTNRNRKKWTKSLQNTLIREILPEFKKRFPGYHLGKKLLVNAYENVSYYLNALKQIRGARTQDGSINVMVLIKEHLRCALYQKISAKPHPFQWVLDAGIKIAECVITIQGQKICTPTLSQFVWIGQKHFLRSEGLPKEIPFEQYDQTDYLLLEKIMKINVSSLDFLSLLKDVDHYFYKLYKIKKTQSKQEWKKHITYYANAIHQKEEITETLPSQSHHFLLEEIGSLYIDDPHLSLDQLITKSEEKIFALFNLHKKQFCIGAFEQVLKQPKQFYLDKKIYQWTLQSDLFYSALSLDSSHYLYQWVKTTLEQSDDPLPYYFSDFEKLFRQYNNPFPSYLAPLLYSKLQQMVKYHWYHHYPHKNQTSYDKCLLWNWKEITTTHPNKTPEEHKKMLRQQMSQKLPSIPYNESYAEPLL